MEQYSFKRNTSPTPYPVKMPKRESSNALNQLQRLACREMDTAPARYHKPPSPMPYDCLIDVTSISDSSDRQDGRLPGGYNTPIYISSSPVCQAVARREGMTPIYVSSSPVYPSIEFDETGSSMHVPTIPNSDDAWYQMQGQFHTPTPSHYTNNSIPHNESAFGSWTPTSGGAPLIWASEVDVQILSSSPPYVPPTLTPPGDPNPTNFGLEALYRAYSPICSVPVPCYDNPEFESTSPRYQTREDHGQYEYQGQELAEFQTYATATRAYTEEELLFEIELDPKTQQLETVDADLVWRETWIHDCGSDADDEGSLVG